MSETDSFPLPQIPRAFESVIRFHLIIALGMNSGAGGIGMLGMGMVDKTVKKHGEQSLYVSFCFQVLTHKQFQQFMTEVPHIHIEFLHVAVFVHRGVVFLAFAVVDRPAEAIGGFHL